MTKREKIKEAIQRNMDMQNKLENLLKEMNQTLEKAKKANEKRK